MERSRDHLRWDEDEIQSWKTIIRNLQATGQLHGNINPGRIGKGHLYQSVRKNSQQLWEKFHSYNEKARTAEQRMEYSKLNDCRMLAKKYKVKAQNQDKIDSFILFESGCKEVKEKEDNHNEITLDLGGQNWEEARSILKIHLWCGYTLRVVDTMKVLIGRGVLDKENDLVLESKVVELLKRKRVTLTKAKGGGYMANLSRTVKDFYFSDSDSDSDSE